MSDLASSSSAAAQRRNRPPLPATPSNTAPVMPPPSTITSTSPSSFIPTPLELVLLAVYPSTLLCGSLFSLFSPATRQSPYSYDLQSHLPDFAPSYFARKNNIFNVYFVKIGWFWITAAFVAFQLATVVAKASAPSAAKDERPAAQQEKDRLQGAGQSNEKQGMERFLQGKAQAVVRWVLVTTWWVFVTQWFFGPAIIDRGYRFTGGRCDGVTLQRGDSNINTFENLETQLECKLAGGRWTGGHDISGHVFLLVLGSSFLLMEALPGILRGRWASSTPVGQSSENEKVAGENSKSQEDALSVKRGGYWELVGNDLVGAVVLLSWWMLLMTAAFFHTWFEKVCRFPPFPFFLNHSWSYVRLIALLYLMPTARSLSSAFSNYNAHTLAKRRSNTYPKIMLTSLSLSAHRSPRRLHRSRQRLLPPACRSGAEFYCRVSGSHRVVRYRKGSADM